MNEEYMTLVNEAGKPADVRHPLATSLWTVIATFNLCAGPKNRLLRRDIKSLGIEQRAAIVVAQYTKREFHRAVEALAWGGSVTDHVAQANDSVNVLAIDIFQNRFERGQVSVNIANDRGACHKEFQ
jgi:hypothetical protein